MNQVFAGATALIIALFLWGFGKKPRGGFIQHKDQKYIKAHNFEQIGLVHSSQESSIKKYKLEDVIQAHKELESRKILGPAIIIP